MVCHVLNLTHPADSQAEMSRRELNSCSSLDFINLRVSHLRMLVKAQDWMRSYLREGRQSGLSLGTLHPEEVGKERRESSQGDKERATTEEERGPRERTARDQVKGAHPGEGRSRRAHGFINMFTTSSSTDLSSRKPKRETRFDTPYGKKALQRNLLTFNI